MDSLKIVYLGIVPPIAPRNKIIIRGLRDIGVNIIECYDDTPSWLKYLRLIKKHWKLRHSYDLMMVGYLSNLAVPIAKLFSRRKIVYNALCSLYEGVVLDRQQCHRWSVKAFWIWLIDFLAFHLSDCVLVETEEQKKFIAKLFYVSQKKIHRLWTGADEEVFFPDPRVTKRDIFTLVFRGKFLPATGCEIVLKAAHLLKGENIHFLIIGRGYLQRQIENLIQELKLDNITLITKFLPPDELRTLMLSCHVCLGQFSDNPRLDRTIQHKNFEALALGMPFITRDSKSNRELMVDGEHCLYVRPADPVDLAEKILLLKKDAILRKRLGENAYNLFSSKLRARHIGKELELIFNDLMRDRSR